MVAQGEQQPGVSRALFLLVKRCLFLLQTTKREKKRMKKKPTKMEGGQKKKEENQSRTQQTGSKVRRVQRQSPRVTEVCKCITTACSASSYMAPKWNQLPAPGSRQKLWATSQKSSPELQTITLGSYLFHFIRGSRLEETKERKGEIWRETRTK